MQISLRVFLGNAWPSPQLAATWEVSQVSPAHCAQDTCPCGDKATREAGTYASLPQCSLPEEGEDKLATDLPIPILPPRELALTLTPALKCFSGVYFGLLCCAVSLWHRLIGLEARGNHAASSVPKISPGSGSAHACPPQRLRPPGWCGSASSLTWIPFPRGGPQVVVLAWKKGSGQQHRNLPPRKEKRERPANNRKEQGLNFLPWTKGPEGEEFQENLRMTLGELMHK